MIKLIQRLFKKQTQKPIKIKLDLEDFSKLVRGEVATPENILDPSARVYIILADIGFCQMHREIEEAAETALVEDIEKNHQKKQEMKQCPYCGSNQRVRKAKDKVFYSCPKCGASATVKL